MGYLAMRIASLRRFHRWAPIIGFTRDGEPIIAVGSTRVAYAGKSGRFRAIAECGLCARKGYWPAQSPVRSRHDLMNSPSRLICPACVEAQEDRI